MSSATLPLTRRPVQESDTGLPTDYVSDLICKHLLQRGVLTTSMLVQRLALAGPIIEGALAYLKREGRLEVRAQIGASGNSDLRYGLTDRGRAYVLDALMRDPYVGPAPVRRNSQRASRVPRTAR